MRSQTILTMKCLCPHQFCKAGWSLGAVMWWFSSWWTLHIVTKRGKSPCLLFLSGEGRHWPSCRQKRESFEWVQSSKRKNSGRIHLNIKVDVSMKLVSKGLSQGVLLCCRGVGLQISFLISYLCLELKKYFPIQTFFVLMDSCYSIYLLIYAPCICSLCQFFGYWFCEINCPDSHGREICTLEKIITKKSPNTSSEKNAQGKNY